MRKYLGRLCSEGWDSVITANSIRKGRGRVALLHRRHEIPSPPCNSTSMEMIHCWAWKTCSTTVVSDEKGRWRKHTHRMYTTCTLQPL